MNQELKERTSGRISWADREAFAKMWNRGVPAIDIARRFGVARVTVYDARRRFGLPARARGWKPKAGANSSASKDAGREAQNAALERLVRKRAAGEIPVPPGWTPDRDLAVLMSGGRYSELQRLAELFDIPMQRVVARWHIVRAV